MPGRLRGPRDRKDAWSCPPAWRGTHAPAATSCARAASLDRPPTRMWTSTAQNPVRLKLFCEYAYGTLTLRLWHRGGRVPPQAVFRQHPRPCVAAGGTGAMVDNASLAEAAGLRRAWADHRADVEQAIAAAAR